MNCVINVFKPPGITSMGVISFIRKLTGEKRAGHIGTLDPGVSGVLPVFLGQATKAIPYVQEGNKTYRGELTLGISTDTLDSSGEVLAEIGCNESDKKIIDVINGFIGIYDQLPPMYSAKKVNGMKLVDFARKGVEIERKTRKVHICSITPLLLERDVINGLNICRVLFDVECSRGTYVRSLCQDIGHQLGCGGHMSFLIRLRSGNFTIDTAYTPRELIEYKNGNRLSEALLPIDAVLKDMPGVKLKPAMEGKIYNGTPVKLDDNVSLGYHKIYNYEGVFIGIGEIQQFDNENILKIKRRFAMQEGKI